jgi:hypothetical protein
VVIDDNLDKKFLNRLENICDAFRVGKVIHLDRLDKKARLFEYLRGYCTVRIGAEPPSDSVSECRSARFILVDQLLRDNKTADGLFVAPELTVG